MQNQYELVQKIGRGIWVSSWNGQAYMPLAQMSPDVMVKVREMGKWSHFPSKLQIVNYEGPGDCVKVSLYEKKDGQVSAWYGEGGITEIRDEEGEYIHDYRGNFIQVA